MDKLSLLIVDDNKLFQDLSADFMGSFDEFGKIDVAEDADGAMKKARKFSYDLYLIEFILPDKKGVDIIPDLRQISPKSLIIVLTHSLMDAYHQAGMKGGADLVLSKDKLFTDLIPYIRSRTMRGNNSFLMQSGYR